MCNLQLPGNVLSINYILLSTLIWLLIYLLSLAIAFKRPLICPFSIMKRGYWYFTVTSCPQCVVDPITNTWCRDCELYLTETSHFNVTVWLSFLFEVGDCDVSPQTEASKMKCLNLYFFIFSRIASDSVEISTQLGCLEYFKMLTSIFRCTSRETLVPHEFHPKKQNSKEPSENSESSTSRLEVRFKSCDRW